jgi:predicted MFS family arabinose efflux permease
MVHHMCGGLGAWIGAAMFDASGGYDGAFVVMASASVLAGLLTARLARK